jgi:hypothetical protein
MSVFISNYCRDLTNDEREAFLNDNIYGILSFNGDKPYAIPVDYYYRKGTILISLDIPGKKVSYLEKSSKICFTICKPRWQTPNYKEPCISVIVEGELEEVADRTYYDLPAISEKAKGSVISYRIREDEMSAKKCIIPPKDCDFFARQKAAK